MPGSHSARPGWRRGWGHLALAVAAVLGASACGGEAPPPAAEDVPTSRLPDPEVDETRGLIRHDERATPGYVLYGGLLAGETYLVDRDGAVVHVWESDYAPSGTAYLLDDGSLLRGAREPDVEVFTGGGQGGRLQRLTWDSAVVWDYLYASDQHLLHHDIQPLPNGNVLAIAWEHKTAEEARAAGRRLDLTPEHGLWPDTIIELEPQPPDDARVVWEWHAWDHLVQDADENAAGYGDPAAHPHRIDLNGTGGEAQISEEELARLQALGYVPEDAEVEDLSADLFHTNAVHYHAELDQIALSVPEYNEIWIIDHSTTTEEAAGSTGGRWGRGGDLLYRWGNPQVYGRGDAGDQQLGYQHDVRWIENDRPGEGRLLIFSNRNGGEDAPHSRVYELTPPVDASGAYLIEDDAPFGPREADWTYTAQVPTTFFAPFISGANRLASGNTLVNSGPQGRFFEVTPDGEIVWEYRDPFSGQVRMPDGSLPHPVDDFTYAVFRATHIPTDHPALAGRNLTPIDPQPEVPAAPAADADGSDAP